MILFIYRYDSHSGGEREIQRTMLELLNQLDGFDSRGDVKVDRVYRQWHAYYISYYASFITIGYNGHKSD